MVGGSDGDFGVWVRQRRRSLLLTQEELAERAKISVRTVQMIESDRATTIRAATRRQLLEVLGPPVEAPRVVPAQLPGDLAAFAGRTGHLATLDSLVAGAPAAVIISAVSGTAGVGKTTLAVHWAHRVAGEFPDGQLYVNLRGFDPVGAPAEPAEVIRGFLDALGVPADRVPADLPAQVALYRSLIAGKRILVILDNARDAAQVRPLLPGSRGAFALITSRSQLTPLVATDGAAVMRLELLSAPEATELLAARLGADRLAAEPEATRQILDACAGLPLALAIAAARALQTGSPLAGLAAELTDRLAALDAGDPATQVATVFSWSYATLSPPAGSLFRLLGRDPAPQTAEAAAALAGQDVTEPLAELVTANLLSSCAGGRFAMHDLLRAYAADLAARRDPPEVLRAATQRLLDHYTHAAHEASRQLYPHRDPIPLPVPPGDFIPFSAAAWFAAEHRVLLAAVRYAAAAGFDEHAWQLAWCLDTFLYRQGHWHELEAAWTAALPAAARLGGRCEAYAHQRLARPATRFGRYAEARAHIRKALDHYTAAGDLIGQADTHCSLVPIWDLEGGYAEALHHVEQASALYQAAGRRRGHAVTLSNMGWFRARLGDLRAALECCAPTLAMFRELGDRTGEAGACSTLGFIQHRMERYAEAAASYRRALELYREIGDRYNEAGTLSRLGDTHLAAGNVAAAREVLAQALAIYTDLGHDDAATIRATLESCGQTAGLLRGAAAGAPIASTS